MVADQQPVGTLGRACGQVEWHLHGTLGVMAVTVAVVRGQRRAQAIGDGGRGMREEGRSRGELLKGGDDTRIGSGARRDRIERVGGGPIASQKLNHAPRRGDGTPCVISRIDSTKRNTV